ncbi:hypothetical protein A2865_03055 [Candidatus Woesebacteria bacterium RIFCSPHIGHO2_01_FULL_39_17]|uniref:Uncharacterized protein n=3 Tax=Candidatus Woeseibacteriota TaxID=1752722 RepID=A0A0G0NBN6_9BACT|nr:MAG: hypothetical protein US72_C0018G0012 [Microgenomates group bacterium GW2011_GWC1_38_12]KKQ94116.1 MAG: hypothetical protein UT19_C0004G0077 [Candidatus Woesebacteria bacterium GW2011_GWB1_39_10b]KKR13574.1 MAG: hypothetical protein UT40_C0014G0030 [Candidatus Woesebacteria bacterium GW2011_GWA1_39_21b]OGM22541.1 MAG: hypothetical protein A2865_03055 [Candidatus Woesebacteria bacterium RIFCSPHIGHO2_01_FULL_39_17]OGM63664.1 MAG: hypothetical protein A3A52_02470 [Candidatus Woesebacteria b
MEGQTPGQSAAQTNVGIEPQTRILKKFPKVSFDKRVMSLVLTSFLVVLAGVGTGWLLSGGSFSTKLGSKEAETEASKGIVTGQNEAGFTDESVFTEKQSPEGILIEGGIKGEGTHHLDRGLGEDKYVYLTSTVIDLQSFVGKKVKVWGETISALQAGWLMDVGKIKVIE